MFRLAVFAAIAAVLWQRPMEGQSTFTVRQVLSAPYASELTAAPVGGQFAWVENAEGVRNIWVASATEAGRQVTHYSEDDGQDIAEIAWSPDASAIVYTYGAGNGASSRPANPAHLQRDTVVHLKLQALAPGAQEQDLGEGHGAVFAGDGRAVMYVRGGTIMQVCVMCCGQEKVCTCGYDQRHGSVPAADLTSRAYRLVYDRGSARSLVLSPDSTKLAYISGRGTHSLLGLFDLRTLVLTFPAASTGNDSAPAFSRKGLQLAWLRAPFTQAAEFALNHASGRTSANPWSIEVLDLKTAQTRTVFTPPANRPGSVLPRFASGEPHVWWTAAGKLLFCSEADGWNHLYAIDALAQAAGKAVPLLLTRGDYEVEDVSVSADGQFAIFAANELLSKRPATCVVPACGPDTTVPDRLDPDRRHVAEISLGEADLARGAFATSGGNGAEMETHPVNSLQSSIAMLASSAQLPMHVALLDAYGKAHAVPAAAVPAGYPAESLVTPQQVLFAGGDHAFELHGQLFLPRNFDAKTKHAAIVFLHGGPKRQMLLGYPTIEYYSNAYGFNQYLASRGYVVLSVNYRGGIGYGLDFRQCEHCGAAGAAEYADVLAARAYLAARPDVDAKRIGVWGGSYGGYLTGLALARNSDLFAAGVDIHGVHEWALEDASASEALRRSVGASLGDEEKAAAVAHASSPMADVAKWRSPVLLIHGDDDPSVAYAQTPMLADALRARGVHVEELIFPDEVHDFLLHRTWVAAFEAAGAFFDRMLMPAGHK